MRFDENRKWIRRIRNIHKYPASFTPNRKCAHNVDELKLLGCFNSQGIEFALICSMAILNYVKRHNERGCYGYINDYYPCYCRCPHSWRCGVDHDAAAN